VGVGLPHDLVLDVGGHAVFLELTEVAAFLDAAEPAHVADQDQSGIGLASLGEQRLAVAGGEHGASSTIQASRPRSISSAWPSSMRATVSGSASTA
tara:strand:+ start:797 stop:1084 length:288 start_codon:yes stop_codon:yes gene_type:complete